MSMPLSRRPRSSSSAARSPSAPGAGLECHAALRGPASARLLRAPAAACRAGLSPSSATHPFGQRRHGAYRRSARSPAAAGPAKWRSPALDERLGPRVRRSASACWRRLAALDRHRPAVSSRDLAGAGPAAPRPRSASAWRPRSSAICSRRATAGCAGRSAPPSSKCAAASASQGVAAPIAARRIARIARGDAGRIGACGALARRHRRGSPRPAAPALRQAPVSSDSALQRCCAFSHVAASAASHRAPARLRRPARRFRRRLASCIGGVGPQACRARRWHAQRELGLLVGRAWRRSRRLALPPAAACASSRARLALSNSVWAWRSARAWRRLSVPA